MSFDPIANIMERDGVDEREAIRRYAVEAASPEHKVCEVRDCPGFGVAHPELPHERIIGRWDVEIIARPTGDDFYGKVEVVLHAVYDNGVRQELDRREVLFSSTDSPFLAGVDLLRGM